MKLLPLSLFLVPSVFPSSLLCPSSWLNQNLFPPLCLCYLRSSFVSFSSSPSISLPSVSSIFELSILSIPSLLFLDLLSSSSCPFSELSPLSTSNHYFHMPFILTLAHPAFNSFNPCSFLSLTHFLIFSCNFLPFT